MIIGICIRNFKVYKNINYIPLSKGSIFSAIIGMNGVGKSSILEALDSFFNQKQWIHNIDNNSLLDSWIMPVFALKKCEYEFSQPDILETIEKISSFVVNGELGNGAIVSNYKQYIDNLRSELPENTEDYYILPICIQYNFKATLGLFNIGNFKQTVFGADADDEKCEEMMTKLYEEIRNILTYVYVPRDIEADNLASFENHEIQRLLGQELENIIEKSLSKTKIVSISRDLKEFVDSVSDSLKEYVFKANSSYQPNLKPNKIYSLIIDEFFSLRKLFKTIDNGKDIPLTLLSSGEKQQAIISLITRIVSNYRESSKRLIVAMDEPEASLHISLCYSQFEKLYNMSSKCCQVLLTSHWYGFIPTLPNGSIVNITVRSEYKFNLFDVYRYKEQVKIADSASKGLLPVDITLKSNNDLIQSILASIIKDDCYNWIICEGSSDKIYLSAYLNDEIINQHLRIIPVCKAKEVKKMYNQLSLAAEDLKANIKGKVFLLTDTDSQLLDIKTHDEVDNIIRCRRIVNVESKTILVKCESNPKSPNTDIEDALNGKLYHETLLLFKKDNSELEIINDEPRKENCSSYELNLGPQDYKKIDDFFSKEHGKNKILFAERYSESLKTGNYITPSWITEIKSFFTHNV